jgi:hypothetical protein
MHDEKKRQSDIAVAFFRRNQPVPPGWSLDESTMILLVVLHRQSGHFVAVHGNGCAILLMQLLATGHFRGMKNNFEELRSLVSAPIEY